MNRSGRRETNSPGGERYTIHLDELEELQHKAALWEWRGRCIVTNGCFQVLHPGHLELFSQLDALAYREGLRPIIAINSDSSMLKLKGPRQLVVPASSRSFLLNRLLWPFTVIIFDEETPQRLMDVLQPKIVMKGADYPPDSVVRWKDSRVVTVPLVQEGQFKWSTSRFIEGLEWRG